MKLIFASSDLWRVFNGLTSAAQKDDAIGLMEAAVMFTTQLALASALFAATARDQGEARALGRDLIAKLETWRDDEGAMRLRLMTYDVECVVRELARAAQRYACPPPVSPEAAAKIAAAMTLPKALTVAAVAFTIQLALEETARDAVGMRALERAMISELEAPWEFPVIPLSVDVQDGLPWGPPPEED
jgi:hypothetical protein